jgi:hypothetical protein
VKSDAKKRRRIALVIRKKVGLPSIVLVGQTLGVLDRARLLRGRLGERRIRIRLAIVAAVAAAAGVAAAIPLAPVARLANYTPDPRGPIYDHPTDDAALREAGRLLPGDARYAVVGGGADARAAAFLYFAPALPVADPGDAGWVLSYQAAARVPRGVVALRSYRVGDGIYLLRVRRA